MNPEVCELIDDLQDYLSVLYPSVEWEVSHEEQGGTLEPVVCVAARRHPFQQREMPVQSAFGLWESVNPATGKAMPAVWELWGRETIEKLRAK